MRPDRLTSTLIRAILATISLASVALGQPAHVAAMGDSLTDEYTEQTYGHMARSWTQILVDTVRIHMGPSADAAGVGYWDETRRTGYRDNWARYGANTVDALGFYAEHTGAASSVSVHGADYVVVFIGGNDFNPFANTVYDSIYSGAWTDQQGRAYADQMVARIRTMVESVEGRGASVVLASVLDFAFMKFMRNNRFSWEYRDRVTAVLRYARDRVRAMAAEKSLVFLDLFRLNIDLFGPNQFLRQQVLVGNVPILMQSSGDDPRFGFIFDEVHPRTVVQAVWAQAFVTALNAAGASIAPLSESDMLAAAGLSYGGADTLGQTLRPLSHYVQNYACVGDFNLDRGVGVQDVFDYLEAFFAGDVRADVNAADGVTIGDLLQFLQGYFGGCP